MGYATVAQVQSEFKSLSLTGTTSLSEASVEEFIEEASAELDLILGVRYVTPIEDDTALVVCRRIVRALVADRISGVLQIKTGDQKTEQNASKMSREDALSFAFKIANGDIVFGLAALLGTSSGIASNTECNPVRRVFSRDRDQW